MMIQLKYYIERCYPYGTAFIITMMLFCNKICFVDSEHLPTALDACNTVVALIAVSYTHLVSSSIIMTKLGA